LQSSAKRGANARSRSNLLGLERQLALQEVGVARRQRRDAQVRNTVREVVVRVRSLSALELGVAR
jgi:hypothetical protein